MKNDWGVCSICESEGWQSSGQRWVNGVDDVWLCRQCANNHRKSEPSTVFKKSKNPLGYCECQKETWSLMEYHYAKCRDCMKWMPLEVWTNANE